MRTIPLKGGAEYDALTRWRRFHKFRAGVRSLIKRTFRRRERKAAKRDARDQTGDCE